MLKLFDLNLSLKKLLQQNKSQAGISKRIYLKNDFPSFTIRLNNGFGR
jgi:hypothetical protein